ncbi:MAG TPA: hypothetical protein VFO46_11230 [Candidatus Sulfotelmatobacter sp.]|nr:hypothetical protein [Candidatus Sulfotelmatobacter sp.]
MASSATRLRGQSTKTFRQSGAARIAPVFAILLTIAFSALAMPRIDQQYRDRDRDQYRDQDRDHDRDHDRDYDRGQDRGRDRSFLFLSRDRFAADFGGGGGGRPSPDAQCEPNTVAVGFHVQSGEYFQQAWLDCAPIRRDGRLGDELRTTGRTSSPGDGPVLDAYCPNGFALRGMRGRTGASIDEAVGECSPLRDIAERLNDSRIELTQPVMRPRPGGRPAGVSCPAGTVVTGFRSNSGTHMDHLWLLCSELHRGH